MKTYSLLLFLLLGLQINSIAQEIVVLEKVDSVQELSFNVFHLIDKHFELHNKKPLSRLKGIALTAKKEGVESLFYNLAYQANELGANAFSIKSKWLHADSIVVLLDIFYLNEDETAQNLSLTPSNNIYIFGDISTKPSSKNIRVNGNKMALKPMSYVVHQNNIGERSSIEVGGLMGTKIWITGEENKESLYYSVKGFNLNPAENYNPQASISFNNGSFYPVAPNFAIFLIQLLDENKTTL